MTEAISRRLERLRKAVGPIRELFIQIGYCGGKPSGVAPEARVVDDSEGETRLNFSYESRCVEKAKRPKSLNLACPVEEIEAAPHQEKPAKANQPDPNAKKRKPHHFHVDGKAYCA